MNICITGVSRGIGRALCKELITQGHQVWGCARTEENMNEIEEEFDTNLFRFSTVDMTDANAVKKWAKSVSEEGFDPDVIVLNAGVLEKDTTEEGFNAEIASHVLRANLDGPLRCVSEFLPHFLQKGEGRFVAISSMSIVRPTPHSVSYTGSKSGLSAAFRSLAVRFGSCGVQFACVYPGPLATGLGRWKESFLIPRPERIAPRLAQFITSRRRTCYVPFCSTTFLRITRWLPDRLFFSLVKK